LTLLPSCSAMMAPGSGRGGGITPATPPTPPYVRFSAYGGWTRPQSYFVISHGNQFEPLPTLAAVSLPGRSLVSPRWQPQLLRLAVSALIPQSPQSLSCCCLVLWPFARPGFRRASFATMASADFRRPLGPRISLGQCCACPLTPPSST
jgi:hypothetical protein